MHIHQQQQARNSQPRTICKQIKLTIHSLEEQFIINANAVCIERGRQSSHQRTSSGLQGAQPLKLSSTRDVPQLASLTTTLATGSSITASSNLKHILNPIKLSNPCFRVAKRTFHLCMTIIGRIVTVSGQAAEEVLDPPRKQSR